MDIQLYLRALIMSLTDLLLAHLSSRLVNCHEQMAASGGTQSPDLQAWRDEGRLSHTECTRRVTETL